MSPMLTLETKRTSSWIQSVAYHDGFLVVIRENGTGVMHLNVPPDVCGRLQAGIKGSMGKAWHKFVKPVYSADGELTQGYTCVELTTEQVNDIVNAFKAAGRVS